MADVKGRVIGIAAGYEPSCVLNGDGTVRCVGAGADGRLGNGSKANRRVLVGVSGLGEVRELAAGDRHTCAVTGDKGKATIACWGNNQYGQLGNGSNKEATKPVAVSGLSGVVDVAPGGYHSCALNVAGQVWCWGYGGHGVLGNGQTASSSVPVQVLGCFVAKSCMCFEIFKYAYEGIPCAIFGWTAI